MTIAELARLIAEVVGFAGELRFDPTRPDGTPRKLLDVSRLTALGWQPAHSVCGGDWPPPTPGMARTARASPVAAALGPPLRVKEPLICPQLGSGSRVAGIPRLSVHAPRAPRPLRAGPLAADAGYPGFAVKSPARLEQAVTHM